MDDLARWFKDYVKPFLDGYAEGRSLSLTRELDRWRDLAGANEDVFVCLPSRSTTPWRSGCSASTPESRTAIVTLEQLGAPRRKS